jgi:hypothetical protein
MSAPTSLVVSNGQMVTYTFRNMLFWYFSFRLLRRLDSIKFNRRSGLEYRYLWYVPEALYFFDQIPTI